jgi:glycosyltransferase involved in cell wall biosynthesis
MLLICDLRCVGPRHAPFNSGLVETVRHAFPEEYVVFAGDASHIENVRHLLDADCRMRVAFYTLSHVGLVGAFLERFIREFRMLHDLAKRFETKEPVLVVCGADASTLYALWLMLTLHRNIKGLQVILHGNISAIAGWQSRNPFVRLLDLRTAMRSIRHPKLRYVVLEEGIREELLLELPSLPIPVDVLPHPISSQERRIAPGRELDLPLNIIFLGLATEAKGFDVFLRLAKRTTEVYKGNVVFNACGRYPSDMSVGSSGVSVLKEGLQLASTPLPRKIFLQGVNASHFVCIPYSGKHYRLSASGVLLDALAAGKPVITMKVPITL